jgi:hypothetical protein
MTTGLEITDEQRKELTETGKITFTPEQLDARFVDDYASNAFTYGIQYLGAGRFALASFFAPVGASLLHHAIEMFLKGTLARGDEASAIRRYWKTYGHRLGDLWRAVCERYPAEGLHEFDDAIAALDEFEDIRYPEALIKKGAFIELGFAEPVEQQSGAGNLRPEPRFALGMPKIDHLIKRLFEITNFNPEFFSTYLRAPRAAPFFALMNDSPLIPQAPKAAPTSAS